MRASPNSDMVVVWIDIWDSQNSTWAKQLINQKFNFRNDIATIHTCNMHPGVPQCQNCWQWGHITNKCHSQGWKCAKCNSPHKTINYWEMAGCYKVNPKANPPRVVTVIGEPCPHNFKCVNCKGDHSTDDKQCPFW
ncbi:hypothetical protein AN958_04542 [Leucoagaricus sp. SymC.cos]|nr:hypothetical protein AN958_04542 [Leucoagaricus sp. SymC.cos]